LRGQQVQHAHDDEPHGHDAERTPLEAGGEIVRVRDGVGHEIGR
jgi:hypothetical protein